MDRLNETLWLALEARRSLEQGESVKAAVARYLDEAGETPPARVTRRWQFCLDRGVDAGPLLASVSSPHRRALLTLLARSQRGESVFSALLELEAEIQEACQADLERHLARLPFILLVPLLFLMFPAVMILLLGPFLEILLAGFGS